jgi:hypothetical protein
MVALDFVEFRRTILIGSAVMFTAGKVVPDTEMPTMSATGI